MGSFTKAQHSGFHDKPYVNLCYTNAAQTSSPRSYRNWMVIIYAVVTQSLKVLYSLVRDWEESNRKLFARLFSRDENGQSHLKTYVRRYPDRKESTSKVRNASVSSWDNVYPSFGQSTGSSTRYGYNRKKYWS